MWYAVTKHWALIPVFLIGVVLLGGLTSILITEQGTHTELVDKKGLYFAMWRQQIGERKTVLEKDVNPTIL